MKKFFFPLLLTSLATTAQTAEKNYARFIQTADSLYHVKDYRSSARAYSDAFRELGWKGTGDDRYNAACAWALAGIPDSAFFNLLRIADKMKFKDHAHLTMDQDLVSLHQDKRWQPLVAQVKKNKDEAEANLNLPLVRTLDSIYYNDQDGRLKLRAMQEQYGWKSKEVQDLWKTIHVLDSVNLIKVKSILDTHGWLGPEVVGEQGNSTLFLVIQHSDQQTQEKYLPMMRAAVKVSKASPGSLALLEDRVALGQGKKQLYGSQIGTDENGKYFVLPLEDPDHVDERRKQVGLSPLSEYVARWNIRWDAGEYKKQLPGIEKQYEKNHKK